MTAYSTMTSDVQVGKVEDVSDIIVMISPTNTPVYTLAGSEKADNTLVQWMEDALDAPASNAAAEAANAPAAHQVPPTLFTNVTQIMTKAVQVSGTADAVKLHGAKRESARQLAKKGKEIKRDMEYALVGTRQTQVTSGTRLFAGVQAQFDSTMVFDQSGTGGTVPGGTVAAGNGATPQVLTEQMILGAAQKCYDNGADPDKLITTSANATVIADFANSQGRRRDMNDMKKIVNAVDVYVTPFGVELTVVIDRWINPLDTILMDPSMWKMRPLRPWFTKDIAITGDIAVNKELIGEYSLQHSNYLADALITGLKAPTLGGNT